MSKSKASRSRARDAKHVRLYLYVLKSDAWLSLSCQARCLLIELQALYNGTNNGELFLSVRDAAKAIGTTKKDHASAAFRELEDRGFIRATRRGTRTRRGEPRLATCWRLSEYDDDLTGRGPSKEFMTWRAPAEPTISKRAERARKATAARWGKISTVPHKDTHRTPQGYAQPAADVSDINDRTPQGYAQPHSEAPSVPHKDTQLVNHVGASENEPKTALLAPARGNRRDKAEWLRAHLDAGVLTSEAVAGALEIQPAHVDEVATGKSELGVSAWRKLATLVNERLN
jgi:hypothetical protein